MTVISKITKAQFLPCLVFAEIVFAQNRKCLVELTLKANAFGKWVDLNTS